MANHTDLDFKVIIFPTFDRLGKRNGEIRYLNHPNWGKDLKNIYILEEDLPFINLDRLKGVLSSDEISDERIDLCPDIVLVRRGKESCLQLSPIIGGKNMYAMLFFND